MNKGKSEEAKRLDYRVHVRLTKEKYEELCAILQQARGIKSLSQLLRYILDNKKIIAERYDSSLDKVMEQLSGIRKELQAIGNNINQVTRSLHIDQSQEGRLLKAMEIVKLYQQTDQKVTELFTLIASMSEKWLPE